MGRRQNLLDLDFCSWSLSLDYLNCTFHQKVDYDPIHLAKTYCLVRFGSLSLSRRIEIDHQDFSFEQMKMKWSAQNFWQRLSCSCLWSGSSLSFSKTYCQVREIKESIEICCVHHAYRVSLSMSISLIRVVSTLSRRRTMDFGSNFLLILRKRRAHVRVTPAPDRVSILRPISRG